MALESLLSGTPAELLAALKQIEATLREAGGTDGNQPYTWAGYLDLYGSGPGPAKEINLQAELHGASSSGTVSIPDMMPGLTPAAIRVGVIGPSGATTPVYLAPGSAWHWTWPVTQIQIYAGITGLAWPQVAYIRVTADLPAGG